MSDRDDYRRGGFNVNSSGPPSPDRGIAMPEFIMRNLKDKPAPECPRCGLNCAYCLNGECAYCKVDVSEPANAHDNDGNPLRMSVSNGEPVKESSGREWWIIEYSETNRECFKRSELTDLETGTTHVIEYSAFEQMKRERDELATKLKWVQVPNVELTAANQSLTRRNAELAQAQTAAFELKYKMTLELYDMRMRAERAEIAQLEHSKICGDSLFLRAERAEAAVKWLRGLIIDEGHIHFDFISAGLNKINSGKSP